MFKNLFSTSNESSIMRVGFAICIFTACIISVLAVVLQGKDMSAAAVLVTALTGPAFMGKSIQKFAEKEPIQNQ